jgi:uncharacterized cysteine cluster protein YcgN (CxxCxxCC family)
MAKKKKTLIELKKAAKLKKEEELESLCRKCGLCCHVKMKLADGICIIHPYEVCKYLSIDNKCMVYNKRFTLSDYKCPPREEIINKDYILPEGCPYTKFRQGYKPAKVVTYAEFEDIIVKELELENWNILLSNRFFQ